MSIPFMQSLQSLRADHGRFALGGIGLALVLLLLWGGWFFTPSLAVYTNGNLIRLTRSGDLVATFPAQAYAQLRPGQAARIYPAQSSATALTLPATVLEVELNGKGDAVEVRLYPESTLDLDALFANGVTGAATVETETISPAVLLMRTTGQFVETPPVSLSPQQ